MPLRHILGAASPEPQQWYGIKLIWEHTPFTDRLPCAKSYLGTWHKMIEKHFLPSRIYVLGWADIGLKVYLSWFSSVTLSSPTLCDPMNCSTPGFPVHHQLPELAQNHVHLVGYAMQPSHPLSSPSPPFNLSQHQGLFQWICSSHQVARVLELQLQHQTVQ